MSCVATQRLHALVNGSVQELEFPGPDVDVLPGVPWGRADEFLSPAYWALQARFESEYDDVFGQPCGDRLWDRVAFCLLGGHGITYEMNQAAFDRLNEVGMFDGPCVAASEIEQCLRQPLQINGRQVRYRFPRVKAMYLAAAHSQFMREAAPTASQALRAWLLGFSGIGPKTASWIVRNHLGSDDVAILDVHVLRAGRLAGIFAVTDNVQRHYFSMEKRFLDFARSIGVPASRLDILMWQQMRRAPTAVGVACERMGIPFAL